MTKKQEARAIKAIKGWKYPIEHQLIIIGIWVRVFGRRDPALYYKFLDAAGISPDIAKWEDVVNKAVNKPEPEILKLIPVKPASIIPKNWDNMIESIK